MLDTMSAAPGDAGGVGPPSVRSRVHGPQGRGGRPFSRQRRVAGRRSAHSLTSPGSSRGRPARTWSRAPGPRDHDGGRACVLAWCRRPGTSGPRLRAIPEIPLHDRPRRPAMAHRHARRAADHRCLRNRKAIRQRTAAGNVHAGPPAASLVSAAAETLSAGITLEWVTTARHGREQNFCTGWRRSADGPARGRLAARAEVSDGTPGRIHRRRRDGGCGHLRAPGRGRRGGRGGRVGVVPDRRGHRRFAGLFLCEAGCPVPDGRGMLEYVAKGFGNGHFGRDRGSQAGSF